MSMSWLLCHNLIFVFIIHGFKLFEDWGSLLEILIFSLTHSISIKDNQPVRNLIKSTRKVDNDCGVASFFSILLYTFQNFFVVLENESVDEDGIDVAVEGSGNLDFE